MTDTFDAVLAEIQQPETLRLHLGEMTPYEVMIAQAAVRFAHSRLAAAHAAEVAEMEAQRDMLLYRVQRESPQLYMAEARESAMAIAARPDAAKSPQQQHDSKVQNWRSLEYSAGLALIALKKLGLSPAPETPNA